MSNQNVPAAAPASSTPAPNDIVAQLMAQLAAAKEENAELKAKKVKPFTMKVSEKTGALCVYGLQRFPVTLYANQWQRIFEHVPAMKEFIADNVAILKTKD